METVNILILSIVQGITELLPISSSAHLILTGKILNLDISGDTFFLSVLHIGTTLAVIIFFRKKLFKNFFTKNKWIFFLKLLISSIPAALIGFLFEDFISTQLHGSTTIAISLIVIGILFIVIENIKIQSSQINPEDISLKKMLIIGISQIIALIPGTSRSGITTLTGMGLGLDKYSAFNFSFILGIPILIGSSIYEVGKEILNLENLSFKIVSLSFIKMIPVIFITFIVGYIALLFVKKFKKSKWLTVFGIYRIIIGIAILIFTI